MQSLTVWVALLLTLGEPGPQNLSLEIITVGLSAQENRALARGLSVLNPNVVPRAEPQIDLSPLLLTTPRKAVRIWIDGRAKQRPDLRLIIADLQQRRVLLQDLRVGPKIDAISLETLLQMIEGSLEALQEQTLGVPIDEALRRLGHAPSPPPPPAAPKTNTLAPIASVPPSKISWIFEGGYQAMGWRGANFAHGPTWFGGARLPDAWGLVAGLRLLYRFERRVASQTSESRVWNLGIRALISRPFVVGYFFVAPFLEAGADLVRLSAASQVAAPAPNRLTADPFIGAGVKLGLQLGAFSFALSPILELSLRQRQFAETQNGQTLVYAQARRLWPGGALTLGWQNDL